MKIKEKKLSKNMTHTEIEILSDSKVKVLVGEQGIPFIIERETNINEIKVS